MVMFLVPLPLQPGPANPHLVSFAHQGGGIIFLSLLKLINPPQPENVLAEGWLLS